MIAQHLKSTRASRRIGAWLTLVIASGCAAERGSVIRAERGTEARHLGQSGGPQYATTLEQFYQTSDGTDWSLAFNRFLASDIGKLRLSCLKNYTISATINVCRPVVIEGCGTTSSGSTIYAAQGITAIAIRSDAFCPGSGVDGAGSRLKDLFIRESGGSVAATQRFGVLMEAPATLERVRIWSFSNGVRIDADSARAGAASSNAERWSITNLTVNQADHAGVLAIGANAGNGLVAKLNVTSNCWDADKLDPGGERLYPVDDATFPSCAGFIDSSKWGSTWIDAHAANNKDANLTGSATETTYYPPGRFLGTARGVCVGCYEETQGTGVAGYVDAIELNTTSIGLSGEASYSGGGIAFHKGGTPALRVDNLSLIAPLIVPHHSTDNYPILLRIWHASGEPDLRIQQDNSAAFSCTPNCQRIRGSYQGLNAQTAWRWAGDPAAFTAY